MLGAPAVATAHGLGTVYQSPLPLAIYLAGAATTVALSFLFVLARDMRAAPTPTRARRPRPGARCGSACASIGLVGWAWIVAQGIAGGTRRTPRSRRCSCGSSAGSASRCSPRCSFPVWEWLDPFATLHDILAWVLRTPRRPRLGDLARSPTGSGSGPPSSGSRSSSGSSSSRSPATSTLTVVLAGYTVLTLALMAQFGRDQWRAQGETFTVWFRTLNRLAAIGVVPAADAERAESADDEDPGRRRRDGRPPAAVRDRRCSTPRGRSPRVALVALGTGVDHLRRPVADRRLRVGVRRTRRSCPKTLLLLVFLGVIVAAPRSRRRGLVSPGAIGAGLLPIAVGYLVAHYLTYLLINGQRIVIAVSDPLQQGWDLFGTAFFKPITTSCRPASCGRSSSRRSWAATCSGRGRDT